MSWGAVNISISTPAMRPELPERYYLDHFQEFLSVIENRYLPVLEPEHIAFIRDFRALSTGAQCLYVRIFNRRGRIFEWRKFN